MRFLFLVLALCLSACATTARADADAPTQLGVTWFYWGNPTQSWSITRGGEGRIVEEGGATTTFAVSAEDFDRVRAVFRPYEGVSFACRRTVTDGPYGSVVWSQAGQPDHEVRFDAGCVTGDADDLFQRLDRAKGLVDALRNAAPH